MHKRLQRRFLAFQMNFNALFAVEDPSIKFVSGRESINERTKSHALHNPADANYAGIRHVVIVGGLTAHQTVMCITLPWRWLGAKRGKDGVQTAEGSRFLSTIGTGISLDAKRRPQ